MQQAMARLRGIIVGLALILTTSCSTGTLPPLPGMIAFVSERDDDPELYLMRPDGADLQRITTIPGPESNPVWSPDGAYLAYRTEARGNGDLAIYDHAAGTHTIITDSPFSDAYDIAWAVDSMHLVFTGWVDDQEQLFRIRRDGAELQQLTDQPGAKEDLDISPDGRYLAFRWHPPDAPGGRITVLEVATLRQFDRGEGWSPRWSPDGTQLVFASQRDGVPALYSTTAEGADLRVLASAVDSVLSLRWSPDGVRIAIAGSPEPRDTCADPCDPRISVLDVQSGAITVITDGAFGAVQPEWTPDSAHLIFVGQRTDVYLFGLMSRGNDELYRADLAQQTITRLTSRRGNDTEPSVTLR
jgi:Tol biopolymer transport system component